MADEQNDATSTRFRPEITRRMPDFHGLGRSQPQEPAASTGKQLIVGRDIVLNGQIAACDKLIVEGTVEAKLENSKIIEIAESGLFKGSAEIDDAVIGGRFEGSLIVHGLLTVQSTGRITGEVRYGRIAIEEGGEISGTLEVNGAQPMAPRVVPAEESVNDD